MFKIFCKIWRFFVKVVKAVLDTIAMILKVLIELIGDILVTLWETVSKVGSTIMSSPFGLALLLGGGLFLFSLIGDDDD